MAARSEEVLDEVQSRLIAAAGMLTARESITMAGWHLLENDSLPNAFLVGDRDVGLAIPEEILRLKPMVGFLYRKPEGSETPLAPDIRSANIDAQAVGACLFAQKPDRDRPRVWAEPSTPARSRA